MRVLSIVLSVETAQYIHRGNVLKGTVELRDGGQLPLLPAGARVGLLGEGVHQW